eukprot:symbB.v1.2.020853.t2/scaffold1711.1/size185425/16
MSYGRGNEQAMAAALFESVESDVSSRTIRMTNFPAGWQTLSEGQLVSKIKALLQTMGHLEQLPSTMRSANGQLMATATFSDRESAEKAVKTLHGVDNRTETEKKRMDRAPPRDIDKFAVFLLGSSELQEIHGEDDGPPLLLCVDDIRLLEDEVSSAREVFVRDLPVEVQKGELESDFLELCFRIGQSEAKLLRPKQEMLEAQVKKLCHSDCKVSLRSNAMRLPCFFVLFILLGAVAWRRAQKLQVVIADQRIDVPVFWNPAACITCKLSSTSPIISVPVVAVAHLSHCSRAECTWSWQRDEGGSGRTRRWKTVSDSPVYIPGDADKGCILRVGCTPPSLAGTVFSQVSNPVMAEPLDDWRWTSFSKTTSKDIRIATYNVLADAYASTKQAKNGMFCYCADEVLSPGPRRQKILRDLLKLDADILGLQEVDTTQLTDDLQLQALEGHPTQIMLDKMSTVAHAVILRDLREDRLLLVANTHLYYHPKGNHIRLLQLYSLLKGQPPQAAYRLIRDGMIHKDDSDWQHSVWMQEEEQTKCVCCQDEGSMPRFVSGLQAWHDSLNNAGVQDIAACHSVGSLTLELKLPLLLEDPNPHIEVTNFTADFQEIDVDTYTQHGSLIHHCWNDCVKALRCLQSTSHLTTFLSWSRSHTRTEAPEDYSEAQLREWLQGFGHPEAVLFFKDPGGTELTGKGYVRFSLHEEAVGLLAAFAEDDEEGGVQGNWSLSERLQSAKLADALQTQAEPIAHDCGFTRLVLLGGGRTPPQAAWASLVQKQGPLTFALFAEGDVEKLKVGLTSLIEEALANPSSFSGQSTGFPRSWREQQVRLVFALFGGVGAVRFVVDPKTGQRMAYVELKNRENMAKAVEQLHNTKVGDGELIEECVVSCELFGDALGSSRALRRTIFLDELKMPKKPDVKPDKEDREVFMTGLPIKDFNEDEIRRWLEGFGQIEEVFLLRDVDRRLNAKGYVRFSSHRHAATCIQAQASEQDAEEGDVIAWWSQSERALRGAYGPNLHSTLASNDGRVFAHLLERCEVREVWMQSKLWPPKDPAAPPMQGKQVHFVATCTAKQLQELHVALSAAVQGFHERVRGDKLGEEGGSSSSFRPPQEPRPAWSTPTTGWSLAPPGPRPAAWPYYRDPYAPHRPPMPGVPPGAPMPWPWRPPGYGPPAMPPRPPGPERKHSRSRRRRREREAAAAAAAPPPSTSAPYIGSVLAMAAEVTSDSKLQDLIVKGEELVQRGQDLKDRGDRDGAYEKFYQGLQFLLKVMPGLGDTNAPPVLNLKSKIHGYLDETEKLKKSLDSKEGNQEAPPMALEDGDLSVEARIEQGETLMQNGQRLAKSGKLGEAYDKYCEGLKLLLQVMPQLREEDAQASRLRSKVSGYLEEVPMGCQVAKTGVSLCELRRSASKNVEIVGVHVLLKKMGRALAAGAALVEEELMCHHHLEAGRRAKAPSEGVVGTSTCVQLQRSFRLSAWVPCPSHDMFASTDLSILWVTFSPGLLDLSSLSALWCCCCEMAQLSKSQEAGDALRLRLQPARLQGANLSLLSMARTLEKLRCHFLDAWSSDSQQLNLKAIFQLRQRFPEARLFLWQTSFPSDTLERLMKPLASVSATPPATLRIGSVTLTLHLRLFTVSESFFDPKRPHRRLLLKLDLQLQQGSTLWPAGAPGPPESRYLCGEGHRWACVCRDADGGAAGLPELPLFCSLKECYLRPAWRDPRVLLHKERPLVHRCQELNGENLPSLSPLRLRSVGRNGRSPRASAGGSPPPPPGDWRGRSKESPALRKEPPPPPRSRRRCSRSRSRDEDRRPRDDMCRPKSAGMPLLRPKSAAKPGARY